MHEHMTMVTGTPTGAPSSFKADRTGRVVGASIQGDSTTNAPLGWVLVGFCSEHIFPRPILVSDILHTVDDLFDSGSLVLGSHPIFRTERGGIYSLGVGVLSTSPAVYEPKHRASV